MIIVITRPPPQLISALQIHTHTALYSERSLMFDMMHGDAAADAALLNKCNKKG